MSRNIKIAIIICIIALLLVAVYFFIALRSNPQQPPTQPQTPAQPQLPVGPQLPTQPTTPAQTQLPSSLPTSSFVIPQKDANKMTLDTPQGKLEVNNVYKNPAANLANNAVAIADNKDYALDFYPQDESFAISIQSSDLQPARDKAEADFLQVLGITKEQACSLKVTLAIPYDVSHTASGKNYGLSFCPNGVPLPK